MCAADQSALAREFLNFSFFATILRRITNPIHALCVVSRDGSVPPDELQGRDKIVRGEPGPLAKLLKLRFAHRVFYPDLAAPAIAAIHRNPSKSSHYGEGHGLHALPRGARAFEAGTVECAPDY